MDCRKRNGNVDGFVRKMSSEIQENCKYIDLEINSKETPTKMPFSDLKTIETKNICDGYYVNDTENHKPIHAELHLKSDIRQHMGFPYIETSTFNERISHNNLKGFYEGKNNERKLSAFQRMPSTEQPLDFSKRSNSSHNGNPFSQNANSRSSKENGMHNSDSTDDSCKDDPAHARFTSNSDKNSATSTRIVFNSHGSPSFNCVETPGLKFNKLTFFSNGSQNNSYREIPRRSSEEVSHLNRFQNGKLEEKWETKLMMIKNNSFQTGRMNEGGRNTPKASNSSESEDEHLGLDSYYRSSSVGQASDNSNPESPQQISDLSSELRKSPQRISDLSSEMRKSPRKESQHQIRPSSTEMKKSTHTTAGEGTPNGENAYSKKNDKFQINFVFEPTPAEEERTENQLNGSVAQLNPQVSSTLNHHPFLSTNPNASMQLLTSRFPGAANGRPFNPSGMYNAIPAFFSPGHFTNFTSNGSQVDVSGYSRMYSYPPPPSTLIPSRLNSMYSPPYQPTLHAGQDLARQKKQRPFKTIETSMLLNELQQQSSPTTVELLASPCIGSTVAAPNNSSPRRQSPDSPCIANGSPGNSNESQDTNGESSRKKIRRIPPEEKDEKYLEKRRKNNLAAKKSRDERRRKEDLLAMNVDKLMKEKFALVAKNEVLERDANNKGARLEMLISCLISFRGQLEEREREKFDKTFSSLLLP